MKFVFIFTIIFTTVLPISIINAMELNAGFVEGLWYSTEKIFADTPVRIYAAMRNNTGSDLTATVTFLDKNTQITSKEISALDGRIIETWADWIPTYGEHTIKVILSNIRLNEIGGISRAVAVTSPLAQNILFVDNDTDKDSIGDKEDTDDDNDGISDIDEKTQGTNPLVKNTPKPDLNTKDTSDNSIETSESGELESQKAGLEQYINNKQIDTLLTRITDTATQAKKSLDAYRSNRSQTYTKSEQPKLDFQTDKKISTTTNDGLMILQNKALTDTIGSFGEVTRTKLTNEKVGFLDKVLLLLKSTISSIYTWILLILSVFLGNPSLVQISLLIFILYLLIHFARKFGRRR